jgi:hypothetical protein
MEIGKIERTPIKYRIGYNPLKVPTSPIKLTNNITLSPLKKRRFPGFSSLIIQEEEEEEKEKEEKEKENKEREEKKEEKENKREKQEIIDTYISPSPPSSPTPLSQQNSPLQIKQSSKIRISLKRKIELENIDLKRVKRCLKNEFNSVSKANTNLKT